MSRWWVLIGIEVRVIHKNDWNAFPYCMPWKRVTMRMIMLCLLRPIAIINDCSWTVRNAVCFIAYISSHSLFDIYIFFFLLFYFLIRFAMKKKEKTQIGSVLLCVFDSAYWPHVLFVYASVFLCVCVANQFTNLFTAWCHWTWLLLLFVGRTFVFYAFANEKCNWQCIRCGDCQKLVICPRMPPLHH